MQDFLSKGNGDSRYLKSVSDFLTRYPTYEDMAAALVAGTLPIDLNGINPNGISQRGTPYNKENVLTTETERLLNLNTNATPNDAFQALAYGAGTMRHYYCFSDADSAEKEVTVPWSGPHNFNTIMVYFQNGNTSVADKQYLTVNYGNGSKLRQRMAADSNMSISELQFAKRSIVTFTSDAGSVTDENFWFVTSVGANSTSVASTTSISPYYTGSGTFGYNNANSISLLGNFRFCYIQRDNSKDFGFLIPGIGVSCIDGTFYSLTVDVLNNYGTSTVRFYNTESAAAQLNVSQKNYQYFAVTN